MVYLEDGSDSPELPSPTQLGENTSDCCLFVASHQERSSPKREHSPSLGVLHPEELHSETSGFEGLRNHLGLEDRVAKLDTHDVGHVREPYPSCVLQRLESRAGRHHHLPSDHSVRQLEQIQQAQCELQRSWTRQPSGKRRCAVRVVLPSRGGTAHPCSAPRAVDEPRCRSGPLRVGCTSLIARYQRTSRHRAPVA